MALKTLTAVICSFLLAQSCHKELHDYLQKPNAKFEFSLQKTPCYGTCPTYIMNINGKGQLHIIGQHFVGFKGARDTVIGKAALDTLKARIAAANFPNLDSVYNNEGITDIPSNRLELAVPSLNYQKRVMARHEYPNSLRNLIYYCEQLRLRYFPEGEEQSP